MLLIGAAQHTVFVRSAVLTLLGPASEMTARLYRSCDSLAASVIVYSWRVLGREVDSLARCFVSPPALLSGINVLSAGARAVFPAMLDDC